MRRVIPGLLIAGVWLWLLLKGSGILFCFVLVPVVVLAVDEYLKMVEKESLPLIERLSINLILTSPVLFICFFPDIGSLPGVLMGSFLALVCYFLSRLTKENITENYEYLSQLVFGLIYLSLLSCHVVLLRFLPDGASWLLVGSAITAGSDTGAYFVGKRFGQKKLCPIISPNKTVEGAIGGILFGSMGALLFSVFLLDNCNWLLLLLSAAVLSCVGIVGDLAESIIKRSTGTKDSGSCLGGHGGILDRVDSLLFVAPVLYYLNPFLVA